ncbi:MAG: sigma-70 family RNA polymerase sigma factor [Bacteroidales bacterium]|nr:sigma-70 family RNA polymerase sigma factor [Bacteroidales bacterium]
MTATTTPRIEQDYRLVCAARDNGSPQAYAGLMSAYREPLYLLLLRMTRNATDAADLTMETFSKAFMQLNRYSPTNSFSAWLFTIGTNTCIDYIRRRRLPTVPLGTLSRNDGQEWTEYPVSSDAPNPEEQIILQQRNDNLRLIVSQLRQPYREIVEMRYFDEMSYEQIATATGLPMGTVKVRLSRARQLMLATLRQNRNML